jgi:two-component system sensor histidine kinase AlgZ
MNNVLRRWLQPLAPYWHISFDCSRQYRKVMSSSVPIYGLLHLLTSLSMLTTESLQQNLFGMLNRALLEIVLFFLSCHFLIRPYLKLKLLPKGRFGWSWVPFALYCWLIAGLLMAVSIEISHYKIFGELDLSVFEIKSHSTGQKTTYQFEMISLIIISSLGQAAIFWTWSLCYILWQTVRSKKIMQLQLEESRLQQLTNQLSPHFLFNAFNSIRALIFEDPQKAADTVTQLSELFRTHLQAHLRPLSTLQDEWQIAQCYLAIEQVRLEQRLQLDCQFDSALWSAKIPTLSLLTLIENAIKHGISPNSQSGYLRVCSQKLSKQHWQLQISNSFRFSSQQGSTQTGLVNLQQRLALMPGQASLAWQQQLPTAEQLGEFIVTMEFIDAQYPDR